MRRTPDLIHRTHRQMWKAINRGDLDAAVRWAFLTERQIEMIGRLAVIDENDPRLRPYRRLVIEIRKAMLNIKAH